MSKSRHTEAQIIAALVCGPECHIRKIEGVRCSTGQVRQEEKDVVKGLSIYPPPTILPIQ
jgi:hypothetical protein